MKEEELQQQRKEDHAKKEQAFDDFISGKQPESSSFVTDDMSL